VGLIDTSPKIDRSTNEAAAACGVDDKTWSSMADARHAGSVAGGPPATPRATAADLADAEIPDVGGQR
jgi:hypothetical protein